MVPWHFDMTMDMVQIQIGLAVAQPLATQREADALCINTLFSQSARLEKVGVPGNSASVDRHRLADGGRAARRVGRGVTLLPALLFARFLVQAAALPCKPTFVIM